MKIFKLLACTLLIFQMIPKAGYAANHIKLKVNERTIATDSAPYISGNHTLVPIRFVAEALSCDSVYWDGETRSAVIEEEGTRIVLPIDSKTAYMNGKSVSLDTPARIKNNRTYIPVRFVAENMGAEVEWNGKERSVNIYKDNIDMNIPYTEDELYWMSRIIHAEAQGESYAGKVAVGNVVMNRVKSRDFPDNIYDVIFDRKNGVQFTPVADGAIYNNPSHQAYYAADRAIRGENVAGSSLFFCNPKTSTSTWIMNNRVLFSQIGNHNFYL